MHNTHGNIYWCIFLDVFCADSSLQVNYPHTMFITTKTTCLHENFPLLLNPQLFLFPPTQIRDMKMLLLGSVSFRSLWLVTGLRLNDSTRLSILHGTSSPAECLKCFNCHGNRGVWSVTDFTRVIYVVNLNAYIARGFPHKNRGWGCLLSAGNCQ